MVKKFQPQEGAQTNVKIHLQCLLLAQMNSAIQDVKMVLAGAFVKQVLPAKALVILFLIVDITYIDMQKVYSFPLHSLQYKHDHIKHISLSNLHSYIFYYYR